MRYTPVSPFRWKKCLPGRRMNLITTLTVVITGLDGVSRPRSARVVVWVGISTVEFLRPGQKVAFPLSPILCIYNDVIVHVRKVSGGVLNGKYLLPDDRSNEVLSPE